MISVRVGMASCGIAAGAQKVYDALCAKGFDVKKTGCIGSCYAEPIVEIKKDDFETLIFEHVVPSDIESIINSVNKNKKHPKLFAKRKDGIKKIDFDYVDDLSFYKNQVKRVSANCGIIDPEDIEDAISNGAYKALGKALLMKQEDVVSEIDKAGLRGRGGAGFPTGRKWKGMLAASSPKFLICNFDEGDPGAFMNRVLAESDPHLVIEGILIAAYAMGADKAFIYTRAEYPLAVKRLNLALSQAKEKGLFGKKGLVDVDIDLVLGAGAYVCGEETALISSIEGNTGRPHPKPPFPFQKGILGRPTNINNIESLAHVTLIMRNGFDWFRAKGTDTSPGTKMFSFSGNTEYGGYVEVPLGTTLKDILRIAKVDTSNIKGVQIGGPSGGCIPMSFLNLPIDYDHVGEANAILGSGSFVIISKDQDMVELARFFLSFSLSESCGQCVPCREGVKRMHELLTKILDNKGTNKDLNDLEELSETIQQTALCGLGKAAPNPVVSVIKNFREDFVSHFMKGSLSDPAETFYINPGKCIGCHICSSKCPTGAITGRPFGIHTINQQLCIRCGSCYNSCKTKAIEIKKVEEIAN